MDNASAPKPAHTPTPKDCYDAYMQGERDGAEEMKEQGMVSNGVTFDDDPESYRSMLYDEGLNAAETMAERDRLKATNAELVKALEGCLHQYESYYCEEKSNDKVGARSHENRIAAARAALAAAKGTA